MQIAELRRKNEKNIRHVRHTTTSSILQKDEKKTHTQFH
jgi:hypothetical protein